MASAFLLFGFNNAATSALPEYVMALGGGPFLAGAQNSLFVLLAVVLRLFFGPLADRIGGKRMLILGAAGFCIPCAVLPFCHTLAAVVGLRLLQCVGLAAYHPNVSLYLAEHSTKAQLPVRISITRFASTASLMVVPAALFPLIGSVGYGPFFFALTFVGFAGLLLLLPLPSFANEESEEAAQANLASAEEQAAAATPPLLLSAAIAMPALLACGCSVLLVFGPSFVLSLMPTVNNGLLLTAISLGGLVGSLAAAPLVRWGGIGHGAALSTLVFAAGVALMLLGPWGLPPVMAGGALAGFGYFGTITMLNAFLGIAASKENTGATFSKQQSFLDAGMITGSFVAGAMLQAGLGYSMVLGCMAAVLAAGALAWLYVGQRVIR